MFTTLRDELKIKEKLSIPSLLGFDNAENVIYLCAKVIEKYPSLINFLAPVDDEEEDNKDYECEKKMKKVEQLVLLQLCKATGGHLKLEPAWYHRGVSMLLTCYLHH